MSNIQYRGTGRRKSSVARVIIRPGSGRITVNGRDFKEYFCNRGVFLQAIIEPLMKTQNESQLDVIVLAHGGGVKGQAEAIRLGLARALVEFNSSYHALLKASGMLTRNAKEVERKHYYCRKARKRPQYSKR